MNKNLCAICQTKIGLFTRNKLQDGYICAKCFTNCTQSMREVIAHQTVNSVINNHKVQIVKMEELRSFTPDIIINKNLAINSVNRKLKLVSDGNLIIGGKREEIFSLDELISYEILTDEVPIYKHTGVGRAIVGGVLFSPVGAIVGAATGTTKLKKTIVKEIKIKLTVSDMINATRTVYLHKDSNLKVGGFLYKQIMQEAEKFIGALENIKYSQ